MRTIKYRAWNKEWNCMKQVAKLTFEDGVQSVMVYNVATDSVGCTSIHEEWEDYVIGEDIVLMQFTGLLDKNGVEIYEGDIVKRKNGNVYNGGIGTVEYATNNSVGHPINGYWCKFYDEAFTIYPKEMEVIGNIYENPELLENTK